MSKVCKTFLLSVALLAATAAFAANKQSLRLAGPANVGGKTLAAGEYTLVWQGQGNVEVSILQGKKLIAKVPAKLVDVKQPVPSNTHSSITNANGAQEITSVQFGGKKYALEFGGDAAKSEATK